MLISQRQKPVMAYGYLDIDVYFQIPDENHPPLGSLFFGVQTPHRISIKKKHGIFHANMHTIYHRPVRELIRRFFWVILRRGECWTLMTAHGRCKYKWSNSTLAVWYTKTHTYIYIVYIYTHIDAYIHLYTSSMHASHSLLDLVHVKGMNTQHECQKLSVG